MFNSAKTQCIACHKVGYVGGLVGPDLTRIGGIRTERDLLEAIVFPSASFVRSYEPVRVVTTDERTLQRRAEEGRAGRDHRGRRGGQGGARSPAPTWRASRRAPCRSCPSGLDQQLTPQDLADLVAFLRACK